MRSPSCSTRHLRAPTRGTTRSFAAIPSRSSTSRPPPSARTSCRRQFSRARRPAQRQHGDLRRAGHDSDRRGHQPRGAGRRTPRSWPASRASRPVPGRARTSTSSRGRPRGGSSVWRRPAGQGDHRAESGRAAAHHAQHRLLPRRRRRPGRHRALGAADGRRRARLRAWLPVEAGGAVRRGVSGATRAHRGSTAASACSPAATKYPSFSRSKAPVIICRDTPAISTS